MWIKKTELEIVEEAKIKKSKKINMALKDGALTAVIVFSFFIIRAKLRGEGSVVYNIIEPLSWVEIIKNIPFYAMVSFALFILVFLYEFIFSKRIWREGVAQFFICDRCKEYRENKGGVKCACGGTITNTNEFKWIENDLENNRILKK